LSEDDRNAIEITDRKITDVVRSICRLLDDLGSSTNDFSVVGVHITNPLEQMHATGTAISSDKVNREVVPLDYGVIVIAIIPLET
jgi:hypothetical protein